MPRMATSGNSGSCPMSWANGNTAGPGVMGRRAVRELLAVSLPEQGKGILRAYKENPHWFAYNGTEPVWIKSYYETGHGSIAQPFRLDHCQCLPTHA